MQANITTVTTKISHYCHNDMLRKLGIVFSLNILNAKSK